MDLYNSKDLDKPGYGTALRNPDRYPDFLKTISEIGNDNFIRFSDKGKYYSILLDKGVVEYTKKVPITNKWILEQSNRNLEHLKQNLALTKEADGYRISEIGQLILDETTREHGYFLAAKRKPVLRKALEILVELNATDPAEAYLTKTDLVLVEAAPWYSDISQIITSIIKMHHSENKNELLSSLLLSPTTFYKVNTREDSKNPIANLREYADTSFRFLKLTGVIKEQNNVLVLNPDSKTKIEDFLQQEIEIVTDAEKTIKNKKLFKPASNFSIINSIDGKEYYIKKTGKRLGTVSKKNNRKVIEATKIKNGDIGEELFCIQERAAGKTPTRTSKDFEGKEDILSSDLKYEIKSIVGPLSTLEITDSEFARLLNGSLDALVIYFNNFTNRLLIPAKELIEMCNTGKIKVMYTDVELAFTEACEDYVIKNTEDVPSVYIEQAKEVCNGLQ